MTSTDFYRKDRKVKSFDYVNALYIYALSPNSSFAIKDLKICSEWPCPGDESVSYSLGVRTVVRLISIITLLFIIL